MNGLIVKTQGVCGGSVRIAGRRVPVWLLSAWEQDGLSESGILEAIPQLTYAGFEAAREYAATHSEEIAREIRENEEA